MKKLFIITALACIVAVAWYQWSLRPVDTHSELRLVVKVEPGMSVEQITNLLQERNVIRSQRAFMIFVKLHGKEGSLQAGKLVLRPSMSAEEVMNVLLSAEVEEMLITIPEGFTVKQIDELLAERGLTEPGEVVDCAKQCDFSYFEFLPDPSELAQRGGKLEGYLFPDTYYVEVNEFVPKFFLERLMTTFRKKILEGLSEDFAGANRSLHEIATMASLIEKEVRTDEERSVISGILWKRYDAGLGLGVDATVRYILEKPTGKITVGDLNFNSPYNTRKFRGLPPGPIASPSYKSFVAALNPKETSYWYYLHGSYGEVHYAEMNEEHNVNKYLYLR